MPRYKLTIEYDGTDFCGWQKQEPFAPGASNPASDAVGQRPELLSVHPGTDAHAAAETLGLREGETRSRVALRTVQHVVERAVREVVREPVILMGASRTDSGVHAKGQVAAFTCSGDEPSDQDASERARRASEGPDDPSLAGASGSLESRASGSPAPESRNSGWPLSRGCDRLLRAINGRLPEDVQVVAVEPAAPDFNPIGGATSKAYSYSLFVLPPPPKGDGLRPMWNRKYVQQIWGHLDLDAMNAAAKRLVGEHDFAAFAAAGHGRLTTVRRVFSCAVSDLSEARAPARVSEVSGDALAPPTSSSMVPAPGLAPGPPTGARLLRIDISGSGFLYNMVRIIAGTLVEVGRGKMTPDDVARAIESKDRRNAGPTLPGMGLCLEWIKY